MHKSMCRFSAGIRHEYILISIMRTVALKTHTHTRRIEKAEEATSPKYSKHLSWGKSFHFHVKYSYHIFSSKQNCKRSNADC